MRPVVGNSRVVAGIRFLVRKYLVTMLFVEDFLIHLCLAKAVKIEDAIADLWHELSMVKLFSLQVHLLPLIEATIMTEIDGFVFL